MSYKYEDTCNAKVIGEFIVYTNRLLGKGKFGEVFEGKHKQSGMKVAVKVSPNTAGLNEKAIQDILNSREVQIMQSVKSENLVRFYNIQITANNVYLFMEICDGGTLTQFIKNNPNLPDIKVIELFQQISNGFKAMVQENIIHRDLKPDNILFHKGILKIADFGFARFLDGNPQTPQYYTLKGTPLYVPPQIFDNKKYSNQFDVWSFGCILYELCFNQHVLGDVRNLGELKAKLASFKNQKIKIPQNNRDKGLIKMLIQMLEYEEENRITWKQLFESDIYKMEPQEYIKRSQFEIIDKKKPSINKLQQSEVFGQLLIQLENSKYDNFFLLKWKCIILYFWYIYLKNTEILEVDNNLKQLIQYYIQPVQKQYLLHFEIIKQRVYSPNQISNIKTLFQEEIKLINVIEKQDNKELMFYVEKFGFGKFQKEIDNNFRIVMKLIKEVLE